MAAEVWGRHSGPKIEGTGGRTEGIVARTKGIVAHYALRQLKDLCI